MYVVYGSTPYNVAAINLFDNSLQSVHSFPVEPQFMCNDVRSYIYCGGGGGVLIYEKSLFMNIIFEGLLGGKQKTQI